MTLTQRSATHRPPSPRTGHLHREWIANAFESYQLPSELDLDRPTFTADGERHFRTRFLGVCSLKLGAYHSPATAFYEIAEFEISELPEAQFLNEPDREHVTSGLTGSSLHTAESIDALLSLSTNPMTERCTPHPAHRPANALKKKKRWRTIRYDIVFCPEGPSHSEVDTSCHPLPDHAYYIFPRDSIMDVISESSLLEISVSFHHPALFASLAPFPSACSCNLYPSIHHAAKFEETPSSKLEQFATVCCSTCRLTSPSNDPPFLHPAHQHILNHLTLNGHAVYVELSGVSKELYVGIRQAAFGFGSICQKVMDLARFHAERVAYRQAEITLRPEVSLHDQSAPSTASQPELQSEKILANSGEDEGELPVRKDTPEEVVIASPTHRRSSSSTSSVSSSKPSTTHPRGNNHGSNKCCLYCGSKTTPMWRRGPQGAGTLCNACGVKWKHGKILSGNMIREDVSIAAHEPSGGKSVKRKKRSSVDNPKRKRSKSKQQQQQSMTATPSNDVHGSRDSPVDDFPEIGGNGHDIHDTRDSSISIDENLPSSGEMSDARYSSLDQPSTSSSNQSISEVSSSVEYITSSVTPFPSLYIHDQTTLSVVEKLGFSGTAYPLSVGVDAVEAATVLTLLRRS
ncbi:uncharacterized protein BYT42DRAFT_578050 [Radiomyces spectabilis]|uniref:uncharacterized protein n=1 Tax=Radiomyces spectabilis TaxID=64574 RepID=UPI00221E86CB|nr:uncharacterized protein BYT42DRAFT_578050 [Radiomyces spectabilis]KAI8372796.1 hypothetical protein BYT42DRAFT_578050 [Radiomyces spectabilis]